MAAKADEAIVVEGLEKSFKDLKVLRGVDFKVKSGSIFALLGPNGAGKTTTIKILSTLLQPNGGQAFINGFNVVNEPERVRASIGLTGQYAAVDEYLTGKENLQMMGRLYRLSKNDAKIKSNKLLEDFDLNDASGRPVKTYSGGMRRRLDLAMSLIASPPILFLDEPTTGLDPRSRLTMWEIIQNLAKAGTTVLLTTQYMDEADHLADNIVVIDNGEKIAEGTPSALKTKVGSDRLELRIAQISSYQKALSALKNEDITQDSENRVISIATKSGVDKLKQILQRLDKANVNVESIELRRPTLDDVFLSLTGHVATQESENKNE